MKTTEVYEADKRELEQEVQFRGREEEEEEDSEAWAAEWSVV
jgi:hypothetical protein